MNTPICGFVQNYAAGGAMRFHMPGHKGRARLGPEPLDITEIAGADVLYAPESIIRESEENAALLFGSARTVYATEGSSLCIRAMVYLAEMDARRKGFRQARIAAGRNAHRVFLEAAALLDTGLIWMNSGDDLLFNTLDPEAVEELFRDPDTAPTAVYVTSPDYLGNRVDLKKLADICHRHDALLLVDNAHGAYLKFLADGMHPLDLGADLCCDSAHKTLPVLTGGAYLHFGKDCPEHLPGMAERAMSLFASTSPSWLILQSLDAANALLAGSYPEQIRCMAEKLTKLKARLRSGGWPMTGDEALKLTLCPKEMGYRGEELERLLAEHRCICEFADPDFTVLMFTPETTDAELKALEEILCTIPRRPAIREKPPIPGKPVPVFSPRETMLMPFERIPTEDSVGRILASPGVSCPPAVPIVICGERINENARSLFRYYGIEQCDVITERDVVSKRQNVLS